MNMMFFFILLFLLCETGIGNIPDSLSFKEWSSLEGSVVGKSGYVLQSTCVTYTYIGIGA